MPVPVEGLGRTADLLCAARLICAAVLRCEKLFRELVQGRHLCRCIARHLLAVAKREVVLRELGPDKGFDAQTLRGRARRRWL